MIKLPDDNNYYDKSSNIGIDPQAQWEQARQQGQLEELIPTAPETVQEITLEPHYQYEREDKQIQRLRSSNWMYRLSQIPLTFCKSFTVDPKSLHGKVYVTPEARDAATKLAWAGTIANGINTIGMLAIVLAMMEGLGIVALPASAVMLYCLNAIQNNYCEHVARDAATKANAPETNNHD